MNKTRQIALITGGSRGLGKSMALKLAKDGHHIILTYLSKKEEAQAVVQEVEQLGQLATALPFDVGNLDQQEVFIHTLKETLVEQFDTDKLSFLINNAGIGASLPYHQVDTFTFDQFFNIHLKGVYFLTQQLLPVIEDGGRIINVSSGTTRYFIPGYSMYATMKGAIETFTKY
ncbi:MAG: SDR family NAD(P)-dependent oxidoreductase, partial [Cyclobacteriaceae bacterium]|nr:SDR family NAD(P)-dependent oxidoreductase [Cyclobacteriaceae bacterium HetDA_MAG_MS6]